MAVRFWLGFCKNYRTMARLFIGVLIAARRGFGILTNLSQNRLQITTDKEINSVLNERLNGYELGFTSGLSPNGSDVCLLGWILANGLVERIRTWRPDWPAVAGVLGLGWVARKQRNGREKEKLVRPGSASSWVSAHCQIGIRKSFSFSNLLIICKLI
jgi:hypothetical protein